MCRWKCHGTALTMETYSCWIWGKEGVEWAVGNGIICGREKNNLAPREVTTRAECAVILNRFITTMKDLLE